MDILQSFLQSFHLEEVFASLQGFLGSGYIFLVVIGFIILGAVKKLLKLLTIGVIAGLVWFACSSGMVDQLLQSLGM